MFSPDKCKLTHLVGKPRAVKLTAQAPTINAGTTRNRKSKYDNSSDLRSDEAFPKWLRQHPGAYVPVFIPPKSKEADQKYFAARIVGKPDVVNEEGLRAGLNTYPKGTHVMELQWFSLHKTTASEDRVYLLNKAQGNDVVDFGSIIRFDHREFDQSEFKLKFNRKCGYVLPAALHEQVTKHMISVDNK